MAEPIIPRRWRKPLLLGLSALVFVAIVALAHEVMTPFVMAMVIAYVLTPAVSWVERFRIKRGWAIIVVYVAVLGSLGVFGRLAAPRVGQELGNLGRELRHDAAAARDHWIPVAQERLRQLGLEGAQPPEAEPGPALVVRPQPDGSYAVEVARGVVIEPKGQRGWVITPREPEGGRVDLARMADEAIAKTVAYVHANAVDLLKFGGNLVASAARAVFVFGITLMLAAYLILTRERIQGFFRSLVDADARGSFDALLERLDHGLQGVIRGQLVICLVNGVLTAIGFALIGVKYWPVLSLFATVLSLIPIFGVIVSSVPAVAVALTQNIGTAVLVFAWIVVIHQIEANFLNPKIMGDAAKIHPVLVIFSLIVGEYLFHAKGALLAVPCMSIAQSVFLHFRDALAAPDPEGREGA
jgi:predicted PurR-regulated permease PerM